MIEIVVLAVFFGVLIVGSLIAARVGVLPSADELAEEDRVRFSRWGRKL